MPDPKPQSRRGLAFLLKFFGLLALFFLILAPRPVNDAVVEPFTGWVAEAGAFVCRIFGEPVVVEGVSIRSHRFSVNIHNGCNGLETVLIFVSAVLAFPAPWKTRLAGLAAGILAIQAVNLLRIAGLFYTGIYFPKVFDKTHSVIWPAAVILFGVALFILWADRFALPHRGETTSS
jgi:exosortase H (IPTLxxWG-CTERM-specific)